MAIREIDGAAARSISKRFALRSDDMSELPVTFPPGRARLATSLMPTMLTGRAVREDRNTDG
jgi:hypothetical protein